MNVKGIKQFLHREINEKFVATVFKISTLNKDVLDSEWTLTRLVGWLGLNGTFSANRPYRAIKEN